MRTESVMKKQKDERSFEMTTATASSVYEWEGLKLM